MKFQHHNPIHYSPAGNSDMLDTVVHKNVQLLEVSDIGDSDHLPIIFHILDHIKTTKLSGQIEKFTYWKQFQSLPPELISPRIQINSG
jgi:hypothetical protein